MQLKVALNEKRLQRLMQCKQISTQGRREIIYAGEKQVGGAVAASHGRLVMARSAGPSGVGPRQHEDRDRPRRLLLVFGVSGHAATARCHQVA